MLQEHLNKGNAMTVAVLSLWMFIQSVESSTYHIALPTMTPVANLAKTALLRVSDTSAEATVPIQSCNPSTSENYITLGSTCTALFPSGVGLSQKGIKVESDSDFNLHVLPVTGSNGQYGDGYLALSDEQLGNEYYVVTYCTTGGECQFSVVGTAQGTSVSIDFPVDINTVSVCVNGQIIVSKGSSTPFTLNENDVLHLVSLRDLSGSYIRASEKVAVFAGASGVQYGDGSVLIFEQMLPKVKWAKEYVVIPNELNDAGDIVKIVTMTDNTKIEITGYSPFVISKPYTYGATVERRIDWRMYSTIKASNPVHIVQVMGVNLYNDTNNVGGPPAMVILQSPKQWHSENPHLFCDAAAAAAATLPTNSLIFKASENANIPPGLGDILSDEKIQATNIDVSVHNASTANSIDFDISNTKIGLSIYCNYGDVSASAMLLSNNLDENFEDCRPSISTPGDDIDNDCNGQIDEVRDCTVEDLKTSFNSTQPGTGNSEQLTRGTSLPGYIKFRASTCGVAEVILWCESDSGNHAALQISQNGLSLHAGGVEAEDHTFSSAIDCEDLTDFWLKWERADPNTIITASKGTSTADTPQVSVTSTEDCFDQLTFHSLAGESNFVINAGKDCNKIIEDEADNYGVRFVIPVKYTDTSFAIYATAAEVASTISFTSMGNSVTTPNNIQVAASSTNTIQKSYISNSATYEYLIMQATTEVSVYLHRVSSSGEFATTILPTDILGPAYHAAKLNYTTPSDCTVYSIDRELTPVDESMTVVAEHGHGDYTESFLEFQQIMPVFCGNPAAAVVQVPPRETLGTFFYIPSITDDIIEDALITVVTSEDSTYIKIRGDYDREDIEDIQGTRYYREFVEGEVFSIETNKPVLVYLELRLTSDQSNSIAIVIPPKSQYKTKSVLPALDLATLVGSYCVDDQGNQATTEAPTTIPAAAEQLTFTDPTFCIVLWSKSSGSPSQVFAWTSDIKLEDQNELCVLANGTMADADDDCDGLTNEEVCYRTITPGLIDIDIDGSVNEDCDPQDTDYNSYTTYSESFSLEVNANNVECGVTGEDSTTTSTGTFDDIPPTPIPQYASPSGTPPQIPTEPIPTYEPIDTLVNSTATVSLSNAFGNSTESNQTAPVRYCDCVCPCGWTNPPNLTETELKEKVEQIQEKLKIKKTALSAWIRSKTSAQDNRPSATAVGTAGVTFLVVTLASVVMLDFASLLRDLRLLRENLKQAFEM